MKKFLLFILLLISSLSYSQTLLEAIDLPSGTFYNYAYGLAYNNSKYWISSGSSTSGNGIINAVNSSGVQIDQIIINYPAMRYSQGLAHDGTYFWYLERRGSTHGLFKVDASGNVIDSIKIFGSKYLGGAGWDGTGVWVSCYYPNNEAALYKVDVSTKNIVDTISTIGTQPQGITVKGDTLFYVMDDNDGDDERVFAVDLATEDTLFSFHVPDQSSQSPRGLAWDGTYFWLLAEPVGGNLNQRQLFKYDLGGSGTPEITVPFSTINFPNTTVGNTSSYNLTIYSTGTATLTLDSITVSGSNFSIDPLSFPINIPAGSSQNTTVNFTPSDYAFYQGLLKIYSNDPIEPVVDVNLRGQGVLSGARIGLSATSYNFGNVWVGEEGVAFWDFKIFNMGDQSLQISDLQFNLPEYSYNAPTVPFQIYSTDTLQLTAYFYPMQVGTFFDTLKISNNDVTTPIARISVQGTAFFNPYNYGYTFWQYQVPENPYGGNTWRWVEGLKPINDITGDAIPEVIVCTDNGWTMCIEGAASGSSFPLWTFNTHINNNNSGSIGANGEYGVQDAIQIADDLNGDGYNDIVIALGGGNEHVYVLDGTNGEIVWKFGDEINYGLGDFEAIDVQRDFNGDNIEDVLAIADGNELGTGYKRAYLFNGTNGNILWEHFYPGPNLSFGKTIISIDDFTGDNVPEAVIAYGNNGTTDLAVRALNGSNGQTIWTRDMVEKEPKELLALPLPAGGTDIIAAEYFNRIHRLNGRTGNIEWTYLLGASAGVIQIGLIDDINSDQIPDVLVASFAGNGFNCLSGATGTQLWAWPMAFQFGVASIPDIDDDGFEDVIVGCQDQFLYCINGKGDSLIFKNQFSDRVYAVNVMPSIDGNFSYEALAGTRDSKVICLSGGTDFVSNTEIAELIPADYSLLQNYPNPFNPSTIIEFKIPEVGLATLKIYDLLGRELKTLVNEEMQPGVYKIDFDASGLASGIYFYTLQTGEFMSTKKMVLLK
ncbi:MAG: choice-of-anchor D domain-containing protein [Ignavibacteriaceae bacterium]|nr:choice-of-anchor D domain-containing protein [Ignavibacteriaceae bacterium]